MEESSKKVLMTYEGVKALEEELENLKVVKRKEVGEKLKEARAQGDLSENAEYDAAKDEQRDIELRIEEIEKTLKNVEVADDDSKKNVVSIGCKVKVFNEGRNKEFEYKIVGSNEGDILQNKISIDSPVGSALLDKKKNQKVTIDTPSGTITYKILAITK